MSTLLNFSQFALTRTEMKVVSGGQQCYYRDGNTVRTCNGLSDCKDYVTLGWGQNYCCSGCSSAKWCKGGKCPQ